MPIPPRKPSLEVQTVETQSAEVVKSSIPSRDESVSLLLAKAYEKASQLKLTPDEIKRLTADFDDADFQRGAGGDMNLIYLEHRCLRDRLNEVVGLGQWKCLARRNWTEDFQAGKPLMPGIRIYMESALLIRGCLVGEGIGNGSYFKHNPKTTFSDAFESAKTSAFRLCCKDFGIGLQAYSKEWSENWKSKYPGFERPKKGK